MSMLTEVANQGMSDDLKGVIITSVITILGFVITYLSMKKSFKNEIMKERTSVALEKMATMPYRILGLMDKMMVENENSDYLEAFKQIMNEIYSYGSAEAISIISLMQKENYALNGDTENLNKYRVMAAFVLLATQIKYDVTGIQVNPELWFILRLTDYETVKENIRKANNQLVKELKLNDVYKMG